MYVTYDPTTPQVVQHNATGSSVFNGIDAGRAFRACGAGASQVIFRARRPGASGNAVRVQLADPNTVLEKTRVDVKGNDYKVVLRKSSGGLQATAQEVADLVNASDLPFWAWAGGAGVVATAAMGALQKGKDPVWNKYGRFVYVPETDGDAMGLLHFDQEVPYRLTQIELHVPGLGGSLPCRIELVNLDEGLGVIEAEKVELWRGDLDGSSPSKVYAGWLILMPRQAIRVIAGDQGVAKIAGYDARY